MSRIGALLIAFLVVAGCTRPVPTLETSAPSAEPGVLDVTVLLDLSGDRRAAGDPQRQAIELWSEQLRARPSGAEVRLHMVDVSSSDARTLIEMREAAETRRSDALVVGTPITPQFAAFAQATEAAGMLTLLTLPAGESLPNQWIFLLAPTRETLARFTVEDALLRGATGVTQIASDTAVGQAEALALSRETESRGLPPMNHVRVDGREPMPSAAVSAVAAVTSAFHVPGIPRDAAAIIRSAVSPIYYLSWLTDPDALGAFRAIGSAQWPTSRRLLAGATLPGASAATRQFLTTYTERYGAPSAAAAAAFDALSLLDNVARRVGVEDRRLLRDAVEVASHAGVASAYRFSVDRHAGFEMTDLTFAHMSGNVPAIAATPTPSPAASPSAAP